LPEAVESDSWPGQVRGAGGCPTAYRIDNPAECSGPPHLLGPWGSAGSGAVRVASSWRRSRPATFVAASASG